MLEWFAWSDYYLVDYLTKETKHITYYLSPYIGYKRKKKASFRIYCTPDRIVYNHLAFSPKYFSSSSRNDWYRRNSTPTPAYHLPKSHRIWSYRANNSLLDRSEQVLAFHLPFLSLRILHNLPKSKIKA